jgi:hypothetical protein
MEPVKSDAVELDSQAGTNPEIVAVIAIHGVGQHLSGASADAVSTLLMSMGREEVAWGAGKAKGADPSPPYSGFVATSVDVPLRPIQAPQLEPNDANYRKEDGEQLGKEVAKEGDSGDSNLWRRIWSAFDERRGHLARARGKPDTEIFGYDATELRKGEPDRGEVAYQFMLTQVAGYEGEPDRSFQTVRLEGKRKANSPGSTVHIYDAHYSDLTKPQSNILGFFFAFYQLLFHLANLSLLAVYWAEYENTNADPPRMWRWYIKSSISALAVRLLTMCVPCLNLILLAIAASAFIAKVHPSSPGACTGLAIACAALLGLVATFYFSWTKSISSPLHPVVWGFIPVLGSAIGALLLSGAAWLYHWGFGLFFGQTLLLFCWLVAAGLVLVWIAKKYVPLRPGVVGLTMVLYACNALFFLFYLVPQATSAVPDSRYQLPTASLWAVQWLFGELSICWILCLLSSLISWLLGAFCIRGINKKDSGRKARAMAAFRTGRFAFALPAVLFILITTAFWSGAVVYGTGKLKAFEGVQVCVIQNGLSNRWASFIIPRVAAVHTWMNKANANSKPRDLKTADLAQTTCNTPQPTCSNAPDCICPSATESQSLWFDYLTGLLLVSVTPGLPITIAAFALTLLLLFWAFLPSIVYEIFPEWTKGAPTDRICWLGSWLSRGLDNTVVLTRILWFGIVPIPLLFFAIDWMVLRDPYRSWFEYVYIASKITLPLIKGVGLFLVLSGAALIGTALKTLTSVLDTILDIDNYLRTSPEEETPRAKIAERCVSLLRYIAAYRDDQNRPYSRVIFVAHSLGSMVTTDLLRYLERSAKDSPDRGLVRYGFRKLPVPPGETKLPIYVFSMGSPLRQLLNRFFPHLYWWISDVPANTLTALGDPLSAAPAIKSQILPRTDEMNVTRWTNAYRSGDYIGRSLWIGQWLQRVDPKESEKGRLYIASSATSPGYNEMCIGLGAHTHYWDRTAPDIAKTLDELII